VRVREPYPIQALEFPEADGEELLRLRPRSHPLCRGCKEALAISTKRYGCYAINLTVRKQNLQPGEGLTYTPCFGMPSVMSTLTLVSNDWQTSRRTYVFLRQLMHRFAELGTIGSPGWHENDEIDVRLYLPKAVTHHNQHKVPYVRQEPEQIPWNH
jgi:hypothetical protein